MPEYVPVERTGPAIREPLRAAAPDELPDFEAQFRIAVAEADDDFDTARIDRVLNRWWALAHLRLNPPTSEERALIERVAAGNMSGTLTRVNGQWVRHE